MYQPKARRSLPPTRPGTNVCTLEIPAPTRQVQPHYPQGPDHQVIVGEGGIHVDGCTRKIVRLKVDPSLPTGMPVLFRPSSASGLGPHDVLQTVGPDSTVAVLYDNFQSESLDWEPQQLVGALNVASCKPEVSPRNHEEPSSVTAEPESTSRPSKSPATTTEEPVSREEFEALTQEQEVKWLVKNF